jgi:hypothetical protein
MQCDEKKPTCARCERGNHHCSYPAKFQFVSENTASRSSSLASNCHVSLPTRQNNYTFTTEKRADGGGLFQKWHHTGHAGTRLCMASEPALAPTEKQALQLIACFEQGHLGSRMHWIGNWLTLVPRRIGLSPALDSAVGLMISVHAAMLQDRCHKASRVVRGPA